MNTETGTSPFSPRQIELIELITSGYSRKDAAHIMGITGNTVRNMICGFGFTDPKTPGLSGILGVIEAKRGQRLGYRTWIPVAVELLQEAKAGQLLYQDSSISDSNLLYQHSSFSTTA